MPFSIQDQNFQAALAVNRVAHHMHGISLAMFGGVDPSPEDIKVALQVLTTLGKANMKGPFGETDAAETKPHHLQTAEERAARWREPGNTAGHFGPKGKAKMKQLVDLGWTDRAVAKAMGVRDNAVRQHRLARSLPPGKVWPTPEEVEFRIA
uniref:Protein of unassigned function n=1 Tax=Methylobacterium oryzae CBMB20 TaxID=693986 RepID=A0A088B2G3_9HYPH|nr:hypothetical protein [Methylobacterium oryzae]AGO88440.1 protein of unassigned function [Methylobacterium oryzae CBMB20]